ncbi:MAG: DUF1232 domain-containing protein [Anaerolineaceae bacterium]|nr:DUF1232 domain-containing protein [Anaerolineaceae bacterium]
MNEIIDREEEIKSEKVVKEGKKEKPSLPKDPTPKKPNWTTTPLSNKGWPKWMIFFLAVASFIYMLNPTAGIFELIPDNIPVIGNLDEGLAFYMLWMGIVEIFEGKSQQEPEEIEGE